MNAKISVLVTCVGAIRLTVQKMKFSIKDLPLKLNHFLIFLITFYFKKTFLKAEKKLIF